MDVATADFITAHTPISPAIQGRIGCVKIVNPVSATNCPVVTL
jgi:hypothetical protein